jgi:hypothetical protein
MSRDSVSSDLAFYLDLIDQGFNKKAWHGPNLRGSIRRVEIEEAAFRPGPGRHNIWENVVHASYWKYAVRRRLLREKRGSFVLKGSNWFVRPNNNSVESWQEDVALLEEMHYLLRTAIAAMDPNDLPKKPANSKWSNASLITGIAAHDIYHAGQIQLLKRLARC